MEKRAWWKEAVIYQIYPRSFMDSNGDGIGDIEGIRQRLPYLEELGIDVIWLSPVYKSPNDDNGYDISDYQDIMTEFGTMDDFDRMLKEAHERGIKIVMDLVVNHTSDEHAWFVESRKSKDNAYRDYYIWKEPRSEKGSSDEKVSSDEKKPSNEKESRNGKEPNNWESCFSGSAWELDPATGMYYLHCFSKKQPDLNWENPKVRDEVFQMMTWWCEKGIDGFRMDVISMISKDPRFPDGPLKQDGVFGDMSPYVCNGPHVHEYLQEMNRRVLSHYDLLTVGEAAGVTIDEAKKYANAEGTELDMVFQFEHMDALQAAGSVVGKWTLAKPEMDAVRRILNKWQVSLEGSAWNSLYLDNHDQPRAVSRFGNDAPEWRVLSAKMLATCLHMMKGTPYIYQGEELGMTNRHFESIDDCRDIEELNAYRQYVTEFKMVPAETMLACFDNVARDNARTPMQWDAGKNAGFGEGTPWIAVNPNYREINAEAELSDPDSVFFYYQKLIRLRHENPVMVYGIFRPLMEESKAVYAYERVLEEENVKLVVACNWTEEKQPCTLFDDVAGEELISNYKVHVRGELQPYEARVIKVSTGDGK